MGFSIDPRSLSPERRAQLDELFGDLTDQRASVDAITPEERRARIARLAAGLSDAGVDAYLCEGGATMRYLIGQATGRSERLVGLVIPASGEPFWIVPAFEQSRIEALMAAGDGAHCVLPWDEHEYPYAPLARAMQERRIERLALDPDLRYRFVAGCARELGRQALVDGLGLVTELRGIKDEHEIALLRRANELTQLAQRRVAQTLEPGLTSTDLAERATWAQHRLGLTDIWNLSLLGPAGAFPHGEERVRSMQTGTPILLDTGGCLHGYQSDNTRSWVLGGKPDSEYRKLWHLVRDAQRAAFDALKPDAHCGSADDAARAVLERGGYGPGYTYLTHRLGHGIGTEGHEGPYLDGGAQDRLRPGMCFSNEPGIYLPGNLGLRIEDIMVVTADGADHFGTWQQGPESAA
ncbi:MAG: Xaa-Pro dipeptidase [Planctomycetota bacterium]|jgi:Xaa-Pro dipeptidase